MSTPLRAALLLAASISFFSLSRSQEFVYVANSNGNTISEYRIDPGGGLTPIGTSLTGPRPISLAYWAGSRLFSGDADGGDGDISTFNIESSGTLTLVGPHYGLSDVPVSIVVNPPYMYVALGLGTRIRIFHLNQSSAPFPLGSVYTGPFPHSLTRTPDSRFLFVIKSEYRTIGSYATAADGSLTPLPDISPGGSPSELAMHPSGKFLYAVVYTGAEGIKISSFAIGADGMLLPLGTPLAAPGAAFAAVEPLGRFIYLGSVTGQISVYRIAADGQLNIVSSSDVPGLLQSPRGISFDETGTYAYLTDSSAAKVYVVRIREDGTLASLGVAPTGPGPTAILTVGCTLLPRITGLTADPAVLWPPNHQLIPVNVAYSVTSPCSLPPVCALSVTSNEPAGTNAPDWLAFNSHQLELRAERTNGQQDRVYTVKVDCHNPPGTGSSLQHVTATTTVTVPANQRH